MPPRAEHARRACPADCSIVLSIRNASDHRHDRPVSTARTTPAPDAGLHPHRPRSPDASSGHPSAGIAEDGSCSRQFVLVIRSRRAASCRGARSESVMADGFLSFLSPRPCSGPRFPDAIRAGPLHPVPHRPPVPGSDRMIDRTTAGLLRGCVLAFRGDGRPRRRPHARGRRRSAWVRPGSAKKTGRGMSPARIFTRHVDGIRDRHVHRWPALRTRCPTDRCDPYRTSHGRPRGGSRCRSTRPRTDRRCTCARCRPHWRRCGRAARRCGQPATPGRR
jgi:hypothetical protein